MNRTSLVLKLTLLVLIIISSLKDIRAQESISTARPTLSIGSLVLPQHSFQWEQGAQYSDIDGDEWAYDAFLRFSVSKATEIRILMPSLEHRNALAEVKWMMRRPDANKPGIGFTLSMGTQNDPTQPGDSFKVLGYRVTIEQPLADGLTGIVNTGYSSGGYFGDLTLAYSLTDRISVAGEYWHHQDWKQIQSGITYLIGSETQIDINGGLLFDTGNDYTIGMGISRRFKYQESESK